MTYLQIWDSLLRLFLFKRVANFKQVICIVALLLIKSLYGQFVVKQIIFNKFLCLKFISN